MGITAKLDDLGKPAWIALMILGFLAYWPIGLGILAYVVWSGRMRCWKRGGYGRWHNDGKDRMREAMGGRQALPNYCAVTFSIQPRNGAPSLTAPLAKRK